MNSLTHFLGVLSVHAAAAVCPLIGPATGLGTYTADVEARNRATSNTMCKDARKSQPTLECVDTPPAKS